MKRKLHAMTSQHFNLIAGITLLIAVILLYLYTLDTGLRPDELNGGDLITHQYAQVEARPSNAPGYPLYTMGGWLWFHGSYPLLSGLFNPTQILSIYSLIWGVASLMCLYFILLQISRAPIALALTAFHATTYFFWYYSVTTEQYSSAVFQTLLMVWLAFTWDEQPRHQWILVMACLSGSMLANMLTTLFILPPILIFILTRPSNLQGFTNIVGLGKLFITNLIGYLKQPLFIIQVIIVTALPLLSYGYIYLRGAQHPEWRGAGQWDSAWAWFVQFVTIQQGRDELAPGLSWHNFFTAEFPALMWQELTPLVFFGGLIGIAWLGWRRAGLFYITLMIYTLFCWAYRFGNWFQVIIPAYPLIVIGFAALLETVVTRSKKIEHVVNLGLALLVMYSLVSNFPRANQRYRPDDTGLAPGYALLADQPTAPAMLYTDFNERVALQYLQTMGGLGQGLQVVEAEHASLNITKSGQRYASRQAITLQPNLLQNTHPQAIGAQLIALSPDPMLQLPDLAHPIALNFGENLTLIGWASRPAPSWLITLYWQATQPISQDYTISVRPMIQGQLLGENLIQDHQPVWGFYPTHQWQALEIVSDVYVLPLLHEPETVQIIVYKATDTGFENSGIQEISLKN